MLVRIVYFSWLIDLTVTSHTYNIMNSFDKLLYIYPLPTKKHQRIFTWCFSIYVVYLNYLVSALFSRDRQVEFS